ncbi:MAG TPA: hypothetical protein VII09_11260 [Opitutaceae bacterium]
MASLSLLCAWLCASGAMLDLTQVVAWTRMFAGYARTETVLQAVRETFDPGRPCALCRAVSRAREASHERAPSVSSAGADRIVLIFEQGVPFVAAAAADAWPEVASGQAPVRAADVPVPPPRLGAA